MKYQKVLLALGAVFLLGAGAGAGPGQAAGQPGPRLVLMVVVDQFRHDYLRRFAKRFKGGLKRLAEQGADFGEARHAHAVTTTGPGHAALATGTHPSRNGVIDNAWYDRDAGEVVNCVEDPSSPLLETSGTGRSPRNLLADGLADWIKLADPEARVFGASRKDRGAILPAGHRADAAYWYDSQTGRFITSEHYMRDYPGWVRNFNSENSPAAHFGEQWSALEGTGDDLAADPEARIGAVDEGAFARSLPQTLGSATLVPDSDFFSDFGSSPLMDEHLERFAEALVTHESLGMDEHPDFLSLSFSSLDSVGHDFGPNSRQILDATLRLDRALGRLFEFLDGRVGRGRYLVALSSDHGVMGVPEYRGSGKAAQARRLNDDDRLCFQRAGLELRRLLGPEDWFVRGLYLNYEAVARHDLRRSEVEKSVASLLLDCDAVAAVWSRSLLESEEPGDEFLARYRRSFHLRRSPDLLVQLREFVIGTRGRGTTHGSPYDYDAHVPLLILGPGVVAQKIPLPVATVDLAPTLAELLGVPAPADLDGVSRAALLRRGGEAAQ